MAHPRASQISPLLTAPPTAATLHTLHFPPSCSKLFGWLALWGQHRCKAHVVLGSQPALHYCSTVSQGALPPQKTGTPDYMSSIEGNTPWLPALNLMHSLNHCEYITLSLCASVFPSERWGDSVSTLSPWKCFVD